MAKFCLAIRPHCSANEPPPAEASLRLDRDFTPDTRRLQQLVVHLRHKEVQLHHKSHFVMQSDRFATKNAGWSLINEAADLLNVSDIDNSVGVKFSGLM